MSAIEKLKQKLMMYMGSFGPAPGRVFTLRDFNTQVMMDAFSPEDRVLDEALAALTSEGVVVRHSATEYQLTPEGYRACRANDQAPVTATRR